MAALEAPDGRRYPGWKMMCEEVCVSRLAHREKYRERGGGESVCVCVCMCVCVCVCVCVSVLW